MRLSHYLLEEPIVLDEGKIKTIVIENPIALRTTIQSLTENGSKLILSEDFKPLDISENLEFISNVFEVDFASRSILTKINNEINDICAGHHQEFLKLCESLNSFGNLLSSSVEIPTKFSYVEDPDKIVKLLNFNIDTDGMTIAESILEYMNICRRFFNKKVFVFLHIKSFLTSKELELMFKNIAYERYRVLLIESHNYIPVADYEDVCIIDNDLCII